MKQLSAAAVERATVLMADEVPEIPCNFLRSEVSFFKILSAYQT
jgi:hypothetical protein